MRDSSPYLTDDSATDLLTFSAEIAGTTDPETAINVTVETLDAAFGDSATTVWTYDAATETVSAAGGTSPYAIGSNDPPPALTRAVRTLCETTASQDGAGSADEAGTAVAGRRLVPIGDGKVLSVAASDSESFEEGATQFVEHVGTTLAAALDRMVDEPTDNDAPAAKYATSEGAFRRLKNVIAANGGFDVTVERALEIGCEQFGLETGVLSHVRDGDYEIEAVVDETGTYEPGTVLPLEETMCAATLADDATETVAFADVSETDYRTEPAADTVAAYLAAPVVVNGEIYGTVNFSSPDPRSTAIRQSEREFVSLLARGLGWEVERRNRLVELERYETILETIDDPVYTLDTQGHLTFVNEAAEEEFGYGSEVLGEHVSIGMDDADVAELTAEIKSLVGSDTQSTKTQFELQTADGSRTLVENHLTLLEDDAGFHGTVGVLRDISDREQRRQQLEDFQRAIEEAADGVAVLEDGEYEYIDQTHVDMYGFESKQELLGETWRELYDDDEVARLESVAFPALEADGHWRGKVTGSRPDGSTFPAELSLTIVGDGRLVCTVRDETERQARKRKLERRSAAIEAASDGIAILDGDSRYEYVNQAHADIYGYEDSEAFLGNRWQMCYDDDERARFESNVLGALDASGQWRGEAVGLRQDGSTFPQGVSLTELPDGGVVCVVRDETERRARERELELKEQAMDEASVGIQIADATRPDNPLVYVNGGFEEITGYASEDVLGENPRFLQGEETDAERVRALRDAVANDEPVSVEILNYRKSGTPYWSKLSVTPVSDDDGTVTNYIGIQQDVTDRRQRTERLREQRERLELVLSGTKTGIAEWDLGTDAVTWNETLAEIVGREVDSLTAFEDAIHPQDRDRVRDHLDTMLETGEPWTGEFRLLGREGDATWIGTRAVLLHDDSGEPTRVLAMGTDITDRKGEERERRRNERRFESLFEDPEMLVALLDVDGTLFDVNQTAMEYVDVDRGAVVDRPVWETPWWSHSKDLQTELKTLIERAAEGEYTEFTATVPRPDAANDRRHLEGTIRPVTDASGAVESLVVSKKDVTKREKQRQQLIEERERFQLLTESVEEYAFIIVDGDGCIQTWNAGASDLFGYDAETAIGTPMGRLHPDGHRERGLPDRLLQQATIAGESAHEGWRVRADGSRFYADVRYAPLKNDAGEFRGYAMIVRDMTERRKQRRRVDRFVEESEDVVCILNRDGTFSYVSGSADGVLGYDPDALVSESLFDYLHPAGREHAMRQFFDAVEQPDGRFQTECRFASTDGEWLNVESRCRNTLNDEAIDGMLLYIRDVTEGKQRDRRFESIFDQTFQFTVLLEPDGTVFEVNEAALAFTGVDRAEFVGQSFAEASWWSHSETDRDRIRNALEKAVTGEFVRFETNVEGANGLGTLDLSVKPVTDEDGDVTLLVVEGRDISRRQRQRQHLKVMQRVMRHNIRNDLTKLRGWTEAMCRRDDTSERAEILETLNAVFDKWEAMTEKVRQIQTVFDSHSQPERSVDAASVVEDAVSAATDAEATVTTRLGTAAGDRVHANLFEAVRELVENAVEASADGRVEVTATRRDDGWLGLTVSDDGPGLPEMEAKVLETGEETPLNHGQGLGLWMVRTVVVQAGGTVSVEARASGTDVTLHLPPAEGGDQLRTEPQ
ncbi:PAS domain S-box protein [Halobellus sp. Atlit-31R]|nr:PAS domain S-box protein [Halobellus sp. Atlit-31R]